MNTLNYIILASVAMAAISLIGSVTVLLSRKRFNTLIPNLVAFSAGALISGAVLELIPESIDRLGNSKQTFTWILVGIVVFYVLEQFIHWHHCHKETHEHKHPVSYLVMIADTFHNLIDGLAIGAAFLASPVVGTSALIAVVAHEIPQELGDFGIMIHSGWSVGKALIVNFISSLTFLAGGLLVYFLAKEINVNVLLPFAAGNFIYIAAVDLIPEIKLSGELRTKFSYFVFFVAGLSIMYFV